MKGLESFQPNTFYHVVNHAVGFENLFQSDENFIYFLKRYKHYMPSVWDTYAYCLMPNHIHLLVKVHPEEVLISHPKYKGDFHKLVMQQLSNLLNAFAKAYNKMYNRRGALWIDFTKRFLVDNKPYLKSVINYIHQNPVNHQFTYKPEVWNFSSYNSLLSDKTTLLRREEVINIFGSMEKFLQNYRATKGEIKNEWEEF